MKSAVLSFVLALIVCAMFGFHFHNRLISTSLVGERVATSSEVRALPVFTQVKNETSLDVEFTEGQTQSVQVFGPRATLSDLKTVVSPDGVLTISGSQGFTFGDSGHIVLAAPSLKSIENDSSGDFKAKGLSNLPLAVQIGGSGDVTVSGSTPNLEVASNGSGDFDGGDLDADTAKVANSSSGDVSVRAEKTLTVSINGSGDVNYHGHPTVTSTINGSGDLSNDN